MTGWSENDPFVAGAPAPAATAGTDSVSAPAGPPTTPADPRDGVTDSLTTVAGPMTALTDRPLPDVGGQDAVRALLHDLRQPLAAIRMLADDDDDPRLGAILREAQWMSDLVEQVLGATAGHAPVLCDLRSVVADCLARAAVATSCRLSLEPGGPGAVVVDPRSMSRALGCLVDNAVRAAGPQGEVTVVVRTVGDEVTIAVSDDGPGLGRVGAQSSLGLTITRALLSPYAGSLTLRSGADVGAVATIRLPSATTTRAVAS